VTDSERRCCVESKTLWRRALVRFILQMARRELRASWRRLLFFFACIAVGVGAIAAGRSMLQNAISR